MTRPQGRLVAPALALALALAVALGLACPAAAVALEAAGTPVQPNPSSDHSALAPRLMRQEAPSSDMQVAELPGGAVKPMRTCSSSMRVIKDWSKGDKHAQRTGIFKLQADRQSDGTPLYRNAEGMYLYFWKKTSWSEWRIGRDYNKADAGVCSGQLLQFECPDEVLEWSTWTQGDTSNTSHWADFAVEGFQVVQDNCAHEMTFSGTEAGALTDLSSLMGTYKIQMNCSACGAAAHTTVVDCPCLPVYKRERGEELGGTLRPDFYLYYWPRFGEWRIGTKFTSEFAAIASRYHGNSSCPDFVQSEDWLAYVKVQGANNETFKTGFVNVQKGVADSEQVQGGQSPSEEVAYSGTPSGRATPWVSMNTDAKAEGTGQDAVQVQATEPGVDDGINDPDKVRLMSSQDGGDPVEKEDGAPDKKKEKGFWIAVAVVSVTMLAVIICWWLRRHKQGDSRGMDKKPMLRNSA